MDAPDLLLSEIDRLKWHVYGALFVKGCALCVAYGWVLVRTVKRYRTAAEATLRRYPLKVRFRVLFRDEGAWAPQVLPSDLPLVREAKRAKVWPILLVLFVGTAISILAGYYAKAKVQEIVDTLERSRGTFR